MANHRMQIAEYKKQLDAYHREDGQVTEPPEDLHLMTSDTNHARDLIMFLYDLSIPYKIVHMGCGLKDITTDTSVCPKCKGRGYC